MKIVVIVIDHSQPYVSGVKGGGEGEGEILSRVQSQEHRALTTMVLIVMFVILSQRGYTVYLVFLTGI